MHPSLDAHTAFTERDRRAACGEYLSRHVGAIRSGRRSWFARRLDRS